MPKNSTEPWQFFLLAKHPQEAGFTMIELIVTLVILGILSLITLPSLISYIGRARESEAKSDLSAISTAQQAYFFERSTFANSLAVLAVSDVTLNSKFYNMEPVPISLLNGGLVALHEAHAYHAAENNARNYALGVYYVNGGYQAIICESDSPSVFTQAPNTYGESCTNGKSIN